MTLLAFPTEMTQRLTTQERFQKLASEWRSQARYMSNVSQMVIMMPYQAIIGMGLAAVPMMLEDLQREPDHWFWALEAITDENPVPEEARGNVKQMAAAWIEWGKRMGVIA